MKNFLRRITWPELKQSLTATFQRFPLSVPTLVVQTIILVLLIDNPHLFDENIIIKLIMTLTFLILVSVVFQLIFESCRFARSKRLVAIIGSLLLALGYWFSLPETFDTITAEFLFAHFAIHLSLFLSILFALAVGPWFRSRYQDRRFYNFVITTGFYFIQAVVIGLLVFLSGAAVISSVKLLFDPSWLNDKLISEWWVISATLIAPLFFLTSFPKELPKKPAVAEKFLHFIIRYVAIPFICIYFVILYTYTAKVLLNFSDWPDGVVTWLVIWFSFFGYIIYIVSYHLSDQSTFVARLRTLIPVFLLPQLGMLFYAISLRIDQYGWTVNRYLVVAFGVWLLIVSLYLIVSRQKAKLVFIPTSLFFSILLILIGPWGMFNISEYSQVGQLNKIMSASKISDGESRRASSIIRYLCEYHGCTSVYKAEAVNAKLSPNLTDYQEIEEELQLSVTYNDLVEINYYYTNTETFFPLNIAGYSKLQEIGHYQESGSIYYNYEEQRLVINDKSIDIGQQLANLIERADINNQLTQTEFEIMESNRSYKIFVIDILQPEDGQYILNGWIAY